jgi:F420-dependent oxidoreductase-like protein
VDGGPHAAHPRRHRDHANGGTYAGRDATGLGKPLRSILHGRADLPIYLAAIGPKNVALTAEIADGWIPTIFSPRRMPLFRGWLDEGFRVRGGAPANFDIMPSCPVIVGDDVKACLATHKPAIALYVGGMGARSCNFYNEVVRRYGYEEAAAKIQDLYLAGRKAEAEAAVPDALVDEITLCGPRERIRERLSEWKAAGVTTLGVRGKLDAIRLMAELAL